MEEMLLADMLFWTLKEREVTQGTQVNEITQVLGELSEALAYIAVKPILPQGAQGIRKGRKKKKPQKPVAELSEALAYVAVNHFTARSAIEETLKKPTKYIDRTLWSVDCRRILSQISPCLKSKYSIPITTQHMFTITRIYADEEGESHFEDIELPLEEAGDIGFLSEKIPAKEVIFRKVKPTYDYDFHTAPQRQFIILLDGEIEIETSLGEKRTFKGGHILMMEDTEGKGHKTRNLQDIERKSVFIVL